MKVPALVLVHVGEDKGQKRGKKRMDSRVEFSMEKF